VEEQQEIETQRTEAAEEGSADRRRPLAAAEKRLAEEDPRFQRGIRPLANDAARNA